MEDDNIISNELYIAKFCEFQHNIDTRLLELVNADVNQLRKVRDKCGARYFEEEEEVVGDIGYQVPMIQMARIAPQASDAVIYKYFSPRLDSDVDWVKNRVTPFELIEKIKR